MVVLRLSIVPRGLAIGLLTTKGIPLRIVADREKGRAPWRKVGLPAQSLSRHRFRRALRAFIRTFCMLVCIYVYVCTCADHPPGKLLRAVVLSTPLLQERRKTVGTNG